VLYDWWERIDTWITENRPGDVALPAAAPVTGDETVGPARGVGGRTDSRGGFGAGRGG